MAKRERFRKGKNPGARSPFRSSPPNPIGDSAFSDRRRRAELRSRDVLDAICYKRVRGQGSLYDWQARWNREVSRLRARVEHPFGMLKHQLGCRRVRYRGRARNEFDFAILLTACILNQIPPTRVCRLSERRFVPSLAELGQMVIEWLLVWIAGRFAAWLRFEVMLVPCVNISGSRVAPGVGLMRLGDLPPIASARPKKGR